jgi:hypothetical protein
MTPQQQTRLDGMNAQNRARHEAAKRRRIDKPYYESPLTKIGKFWSVVHNEGPERAGTEDLIDAYMYVERCLIEAPANHKGRCMSKWLGSWQKRINAELQKRGL